MNIEEIISNLQCNLDLMQFDPFTGETIDKSCMNKLNRELCTALEEAIKELQKKSWISVKDRLPEEEKLVLAAVYGSDILRPLDGETVFDAIERESKIYNRTVLAFIGDDGWNYADGHPLINTPSYWMPLPEPPKVNKE